MKLELSVPQMNRLRYLVGCDSRRYIESHRVGSYDGEYPFLVLSLAAKDYDDNEEINPDDVLRSANFAEYDEVQDLYKRLGELWSGKEEA